MLIDFCEQHDIAHDICGKIVVATREEELNALQTLEERGQANGLKGVRRITAEELREYEPQTAGIAGLHVPETGIVDFKEVTQKYAELFAEHGGTLLTDHKITGIKTTSEGVELTCANGNIIRVKYLINCAGLQCDRIARMAGLESGVKIIPFRGEYYELEKHAHDLVKNLIYPVPDPRFPFLGVHFTRMVHGGVEAGPNAVLAFQREGYNRSSFSLKDSLEMAGDPGFWKMAGKYWKTGAGEFHRSFSKKAFVKALQRLLPALREEDLVRGGSGVRAQALTADGALVDDFRIEKTESMIHVLNAPSPAATSSLSIGVTITELAGKLFSLESKS